MKELPSMPTENKDQSAQYEMLCPECQAGAFHLKYITYFTWLNDELVTVPNFPAWICDVCGRREYDMRAVNWLNTLLNPETGRGATHQRRKSPPPPILPRRKPASR
jgi:YgiT-type zinc finger domain-containing protein